MRARVSLLLIALYSTKIIGSLAYNPNIIERKPSNFSSNNKKIICSLPIEQIEINTCKVELYSIIEVAIALIFM